MISSRRGSSACLFRFSFSTLRFVCATPTALEGTTEGGRGADTVLAGKNEIERRIGGASNARDRFIPRAALREIAATRNPDPIKADRDDSLRISRERVCWPFPSGA